MKSINLNVNLFSSQVMDSHACPCGNDCENSNHCFLQCSLFYQAINMMINDIRMLFMTEFHMTCCCMGQQISVFQKVKMLYAVHRFIDLLTKLADYNL